MTPQGLGYMLAIPDVTRRCLRVARRNAEVYFRGWKTLFLPPLLEPTLYMLIIGFGLGAFVDTISGHAYPIWFGPALLATTAMFGAFFEGAYGSFVRMYYLKTYDAITATPINLDEVVAGELLWAASKATLNSTVVLVVLFAFRIPQSPWILVAPPIVFVASLSFASIGLLTTSVAPGFDAFNYPLYLVVTPMFFLSGTFIPLDVLGQVPGALAVAALLPLTHAVNVLRPLSLGTFEATNLWSLAWLVVVGALASLYSINSMKRRLIP